MKAALNRRPAACITASLAIFFMFLTPQVAANGDDVFSVDGQNFHIETLGASGPTVVFESGLGNDSSTWRYVVGPIAEFAQAVLYDRPGLGRSLPIVQKDMAVTADVVATELHRLLAASNIRPPYILVGHSLGGLYMQMFARKYPKEVSGVLLLDSASAEAPSELKTRATLEPGTVAYLEEERVAESNRQVANAGPFPDVPLTVIAATDHGPFFKHWEPTLMRLQQQLATLSPQATFIVAHGSGHDVQIDRPETVIDALKRLADISRSGP